MYVDPKLPREMFGWHSDRLHMHMPIVRYGHWGHPLLMLPTAQSDLLDCERFFLIKAIEKEIFAGKLSVFCIESINKHAWMNKNVPIREKAHRQAMYAAYVEHEVVPHIRRVVGNDRARLGITGASFGAFHAANFFFRRPDMFDTLIAMSGFYDLGPTYLHGFGNDDVYFNNPASYVPGLGGEALELIQHHSQIHLLCGTGKWELPDATRRFSQILWDKGIWHNADFWGPDMDHDWPTWRSMLGHYVAHRLGW